MSLIPTKKRPFTLGTALAAAVMNVASPLIAPAFGPHPSLGTEAYASSPVQMNAANLLKDMRGSLAAMAFSFKDVSADARHRSGGSVLAGVTEATRAVQTLEGALASKNPSDISKGTKSVSRAVGDLQTRYALSAAKNDGATKALQRFNVAWSAYASHYVLSKPARSSPKASRAEVAALKRKVSDLSARIQGLENQVADNAALRAEVRRMRREIAYFDGRFDDPVIYRRAAFTLTVFAGSFDAFVLTTRNYYPAYYVYFDDVYYRPSNFEAYWDGYYDGYYDGLAEGWYSDPIFVDSPVLEISQPEIYQNVTYETIYNVANETTNIYEVLPQEDLSRAAVEPLSPDIDFRVENVVTTETGVQPDTGESGGTDANVNREHPQPLRQDSREAIEDDEQAPRGDSSADEELPVDGGSVPRDEVMPSEEAAPSQRETPPAEEDVPPDDEGLTRR